MLSSEGGETGSTLLPAVAALLAVAVCTAMTTDEVAAQEPATSGFRATHFDPVAAQHVGLLNLKTPEVLPHMTPSAGMFAHYADEPLKHDETPPPPNGGFYIDRELTTELAVAFGLFDHLQLSLAAPVVSAQWGRLPSAKRGGFPFGDTRAAVDVLLIDPAWANGWGLSASGMVRFPTGMVEEFTSDGAVRVEPRLALGKRIEGGHEIVVNAALGVGTPRTAPRFHYSDAGTIKLGLGGRFHIPGTGVDVMTSFFGQGSTVGEVETPSGGFADNTAHSLEGLAGLRFDLPADLVAQVGGGFGLNSGLPAPDFRLFTGFHWAPSFLAPKKDESTPTTSPEMAAEDTDDDGLTGADDECPKQAEDMDGYQDQDGCPDQDNDGDGIADADDECPGEKGPASNAGCPKGEKMAEKENKKGKESGTAKEAEEKEKPEMVEKTLAIDETIQFEDAAADLDGESRRRLQKVSEYLKKYDQITKIRVEGYTDAKGPDRFNKAISKARAEAARAFLVYTGIDESRLEIEAFGGANPVASNETDEGQAKNRRVEFVIVEINGEPVPEGEEPTIEVEKGSTE